MGNRATSSPVDDIAMAGLGHEIVEEGAEASTELGGPLVRDAGEPYRRQAGLVLQTMLGRFQPPLRASTSPRAMPDAPSGARKWERSGRRCVLPIARTRRVETTSTISASTSTSMWWAIVPLALPRVVARSVTVAGRSPSRSMMSRLTGAASAFIPRVPTSLRPRC